MSGNSAIEVWSARNFYAAKKMAFACPYGSAEIFTDGTPPNGLKPREKVTDGVMSEGLPASPGGAAVVHNRLPYNDLYAGAFDWSAPAPVRDTEKCPEGRDGGILLGSSHVCGRGRLRITNGGKVRQRFTGHGVGQPVPPAWVESASARPCREGGGPEAGAPPVRRLDRSRGVLVSGATTVIGCSHCFERGVRNMDNEVTEGTPWFAAR